MRFLCLHGMGTNAQIFEAQLARVRSQLVGQHEFVFVNGEVDSAPAPGMHFSILIASAADCKLIQLQYRHRGILSWPILLLL